MACWEKYLVLVMTESDIKVNWYYFRSLASQLRQTEQFVDHSVDANGIMKNASTYSNEFAKILMLAASEFEVTAKVLCSESGITLPWNANIIRITRELINKYPLIGDTSIITPYLILQPLKNWKIIQISNRNGNIVDKADGIQWWYDYNNVKHDRRQMFYVANLKNCIDATASLMVIELYLSQKTMGNVDAITSLGCDYFDCEYGLAHLVSDADKRLPDFT